LRTRNRVDKRQAAEAGLSKRDRAGNLGGFVKIIDRYVSGQVLLTGFFAVGVLSVVLVLGNIFKKLLDLLVNHDAPYDLILSLIGYILPFSMTFTIPWGFLTAVLLVFGKMSAENELIALRSSGVSIPRIAIPVFFIAVACVGICLWINLIVAPQAQVKMKDAIYNIATNNPLSMFGSDMVIDQFPGRKIYVERNEGSELYNLLVYEMNENNDPMRVVHAETGSLETDPANKQLLLHIKNVRYEERATDDPSALEKIRQGITMEETTLPISLKELYEKNKKKKGMSSMTVGELLERLDNAEDSPQKKELLHVNAMTEVNKRFSFSLASIAFVLIGIPLAITAHRKETSVGFMISLIVAFVYFCVILAADTMRNHPKAHPELLVWLPNVLFIGAGLWLFYRLSRR
jgi:lipopolysaccharide export system permease protein